MSYTQCPSCGAKALSVATQCPRCGVPFESKLATYPAAQPRKSPIPVVIMAAVALGAVLFGVDALTQRPAISEGFSPPPSPEPPSAPARKPSQPVAPAQQVASSLPESLPAAGAAVPSEPAAQAATTPAPLPAPGERTPAALVAKAEPTPAKVAAPVPEPTSQRAAAEPRTAPTTSDVVPKAPPLPSLKHAVYGPTERRYTKNWVNVRKARRPGAPVVTVLRPGEPVQVDSLSQEWYRVVAEGQAVGYVYRGFVGDSPPEERN